MVELLDRASTHLDASGSHDIQRNLMWSLCITLVIFVLEVIGGIESNSLSLKADAGHLLGDVLALGLSLGATIFSRRPATPKRTYGYHRTEVLAAVFNGGTLLILAGYIFFKAYNRLITPEPVKSTMMLTIAVIGLLANLIVLFKLRGAAGQNLNVRAAFLHVMGDMLGSVGVVAGGVFLIFTKYYLADPIISFFVGTIILFGAIGVLVDGANILLEGVPRSINYDKLKSDIEKVEGVVSIHDLHIWSISSANLALSAHVTIANQSTHASQQIIQETCQLLRDDYKIFHTTIQIECDCCSDLDCGCAVT